MRIQCISGATSRKLIQIITKNIAMIFKFKKVITTLVLHSYLKASTGFSLDALYAGTTPEITPTRTARVIP